MEEVELKGLIYSSRDEIHIGVDEEGVALETANLSRGKKDNKINRTTKSSNEMELACGESSGKSAVKEMGSSTGEGNWTARAERLPNLLPRFSQLDLSASPTRQTCKPPAQKSAETDR